MDVEICDPHIVKSKTAKCSSAAERKQDTKPHNPLFKVKGRQLYVLKRLHLFIIYMCVSLHRACMWQSEGNLY